MGLILTTSWKFFCWSSKSGVHVCLYLVSLRQMENTLNLYLNFRFPNMVVFTVVQVSIKYCHPALIIMIFPTVLCPSVL